MDVVAPLDRSTVLPRHLFYEHCRRAFRSAADADGDGVLTPCRRLNRSALELIWMGAADPSGVFAGRRPYLLDTATPRSRSSALANPPRRCCPGIPRSPW